MDLADFDSGGLQRGHGILRFFKFNGEMAGVVIDAQNVRRGADRSDVRARNCSKNSNRFGGIFKQAQRFGFEAEMQFAFRFFADARNVLDATPDVFADVFFCSSARDEFLERAGQGADAAFNSGGQKFRQQIKKQVRVGQSFRRSPVGRIHLFLDARAVKPAIGKSVDGENVAGIFFQPALEFQKRLADRSIPSAA